jgi:O-antigen ligase
MGLVDPTKGVMAYYAMTLLRPEALWFWSVTPRRYVFYIAVSVLIGWFIRGCGNWERIRTVRMPLFFLVALAIVYWISALNSAFEKRAIEYSWEMTKIALMVVVGLSLVTRFKQIRALTWVAVLIMGYIALEMNNFYYQGWQRLWLYGFAGLDNNGMAMLFAMTIALCLGLGGYEQKWYLKAAALFWIPFLGNAIAFSFSRSGMLATLIMLPVSWRLLPKRKYANIAILALVVGGSILAGPSVVERFETIFKEEGERDASAQSRFDLWSAAWRCMKANPYVGVGPRCWNLVGHRYGAGHGQSVHNVFLQVGADTGFPGAICLLGLYITTGLAIFRTRRKVRDSVSWLGAWDAMIVPALISFAVSSTFIGMEKAEFPYLIALIGLASVRVAHLEKDRASEASSEAERSEPGTNPLMGPDPFPA